MTFLKRIPPTFSREVTMLVLLLGILKISETKFAPGYTTIAFSEGKKMHW